MLDRLYALETFGIKLGLDNITRLCAALDHPERAFTTVHVAGTNGKGSVTAMVHAALRASRLTTARYTSPHLTHIEERVAIDGVAITTETFDALAEQVCAAAAALPSDVHRRLARSNQAQGVMAGLGDAAGRLGQRRGRGSDIRIGHG